MPAASADDAAPKSRAMGATSVSRACGSTSPAGSTTTGSVMVRPALNVNAQSVTLTTSATASRTLARRAGKVGAMWRIVRWRKTSR